MAIISISGQGDPMSIDFAVDAMNRSNITLYAVARLSPAPENAGKWDMTETDAIPLNPNEKKTLVIQAMRELPSDGESEYVDIYVDYYSDEQQTNLVKTVHVAHEYLEYRDTDAWEVIDEDNFETDLEGWNDVNAGLERDDTFAFEGSYSIKLNSGVTQDEKGFDVPDTSKYIYKTFSIQAGKTPAMLIRVGNSSSAYRIKALTIKDDKTDEERTFKILLAGNSWRLIIIYFGFTATEDTTMTINISAVDVDNPSSPVHLDKIELKNYTV